MCLIIIIHKNKSWKTLIGLGRSTMCAQGCGSRIFTRLSITYSLISAITQINQVRCYRMESFANTEPLYDPIIR